MQCPVCKTVNLVMADRQGIEIDYCPQCRGVWLDRGELDKIIERSAGAQIPTPAVSAPQPQYTPPPMQQPPMQQPPVQSPPPYRGDDRSHYDRDYRHHDPRQHGHYDKDYRYGHKRKREGFLSDLFDFD